MSGARLRRLLLSLGALLASVLLAGCVEVPTTGPAEPIEGPAPPCQNCVSVEVAPPAAGDAPQQVVEGYLRATSVYQPNFSVAKQFLSRGAASRWSPEDGAQIYSGAPVANGSRVVLDGRLRGSLGPDRSYTAQNRRLDVDFGMVKEDGEWRIGTPPRGLMVAEYYFTRFYTSYNLYFIGNGATLVPDPIYLPNLPNSDNVASVLMKALLGGPSTWLRPAVTTAIPANTALSVDSVTVQDSIAQVPLSDAVLPLNDNQRALLAAQVVWTLKQATGVEGVLFKVNGQSFRVPQSDEESFEVPVDRISPDLDPVPFSAGDQLYAVRGRSSDQRTAVQLVGAGAGSPQARPMPGPLGQGGFDVDSLAVSVPNTDVAVVTDRRTVLRSALATNGAPTTRLTGVTDLLRPQYSRYNELWAAATQGGVQKMWVSTGDERTQVSAPALAGGTLTAFKISPDGSRMALVRRLGGRTQLGLARISRSDRVVLDGWRPLETTQPDTPGISVVKDVGWLNDTDLLVLGAAGADASPYPYQVRQDASQIVGPSEPNDWDAVGLTVLLGSETSVVVGRDGRAYRDDEGQWVAFLDHCRAAAYPG